MMHNKAVDIKGLSDRAALELLCRELNDLISKITKIMDEIDGSRIVMTDGHTLEEKLSEIGRKNTEG
ncbi:MAG: hypothetical protein E7583_03035 [Ruminococcaceae bacterium]|nr:hypothetical protein [Oscillospiraceae bacterium]